MGTIREAARSLIAIALTTGLAAPAQAGGLASLSSPLALEDDERYSSTTDYRAPPPVRGLALHGYFASGDQDARFENGRVQLGPTKACPAVTPIADPRKLPDGFHELTEREFWFFRSGIQSIYIELTWNFAISVACAVEPKPSLKVVRMTEFNGRTSMIVEGGDLPGAYTLMPGEASSQVPSQFQQKPNGQQLARQNSAKRYRNDLPGPDLGSARACFSNSMAFHFASLCFFAERGEWYGLPIYSDNEDDTGSQFAQYAVTEIDTRARIDGRLFEWDRPIYYVGRK